MTVAKHPTWAPDRLVVVPLMCVSFAVACIVGFRLLETRAIIQLDVWFDLDTDDLLIDQFSELVRHPNLGLFVRRPVALAARLLGGLRIGVDAPGQLFYFLMLLVAPVAGALRTLAAYRSLRWLTGSLPLAILLAMLDIAAFATVAVDSVPDSYPVSTACFAAFYWLLVTDARGERVRWLWWIALGTVAVGTTLFNVVPFSILLGTLLLARRHSLARAVARTGASVLAVLALTGVLLVGSAVLIDEPLAARIDPGTGRDSRTTLEGRIAREVAWAMANTFIAERATPVPSGYPALSNPDHDYVLSLPKPPVRDLSRWWRGLLPLVALGLGAAGYLRRRATAIWLLPAAAIVVSYFVLHLFFGVAYFIYAAHWELSMVWVMAGVAFLPGRVRTAAIAIVGLLLLVTAVNSAFLLHELLAQLQAA